jgi:hypothetical protein
MTHYDDLMQRNLAQVFGERDPERRMEAIRALYFDDAVLYEPDAAVTGHAAISNAVTELLASLPPNFAFQAIGSAIGHHGVAKLHWQVGPPDGPIAVTGTDVVHIEGDLIRTLHVFLDPWSPEFSLSLK